MIPPRSAIIAALRQFSQPLQLYDNSQGFYELSGVSTLCQQIPSYLLELPSGFVSAYAEFPALISPYSPCLIWPMPSPSMTSGWRTPPPSGWFWTLSTVSVWSRCKGHTSGAKTGRGGPRAGAKSFHTLVSMQVGFPSFCSPPPELLCCISCLVVEGGAFIPFSACDSFCHTL